MTTPPLLDCFCQEHCNDTVQLKADNFYVTAWDDASDAWYQFQCPECGLWNLVAFDYSELGPWIDRSRGFLGVIQMSREDMTETVSHEIKRLIPLIPRERDQLVWSYTHAERFEKELFEFLTSAQKFPIHPEL